MSYNAVSDDEFTIWDFVGVYEAIDWGELLVKNGSSSGGELAANSPPNRGSAFAGFQGQEHSLMSISVPLAFALGSCQLIWSNQAKQSVEGAIRPDKIQPNDTTSAYTRKVGWM